MADAAAGPADSPLPATNVDRRHRSCNTSERHVDCLKTTTTTKRLGNMTSLTVDLFE
eukprot:m.83428 g.83428  ORF g.83428 m.83428 type:complete len:57 (+) comp11204_c0_seq2:130-300(+)